jgi:hypothetical protein
MTIRDVELHYQDAVSYREAIKRWARTILEEMKPQVKIEL